MKKLVFIIFLFAFAFGLECVGQFSPNKQIIYGTPRSDGYDFVKKGALWASHPEAKIIYEGGHVDGFNELVLKADAFARFIDTEHNSKDNNYIVIPKGEIIYWETKIGQPRSARCANALEFVGYVTDIVVKPLDEKPAAEPPPPIVAGGKVLDYGGGEEVLKNDPPKPSPLADLTKGAKEYTKFGKWHRKNWWWADSLAGLAIGTGVGFVAHDSGHSWYFWFPKSSPHGTMSNGKGN